MNIYSGLVFAQIILFELLKALFELSDCSLFLKFLILGNSQKHESFIPLKFKAFEPQVLEEHLLIVRDLNPAQLLMNNGDPDSPLFPLSEDLKLAASAPLVNLEGELDLQNTLLAHILLPPVHDPVENESAEQVSGFDQLLPLLLAPVVVQQPGVEEQGQLAPRSRVQVHFAALDLLRKLAQLVLPLFDGGGLVLFEEIE